MRAFNRILGLLVVAAGLGLAGWAPPIFELLSGQALPSPVATDGTAMAIWSGVAFVRVLGAAMVGIGAALWASHAPTPTPRGVQASLFVSFVFAGLIVSAQQIAIWANAVGWALVTGFSLLALITGITLVRSGRDSVPGGAA
jgi:hypothetical protein